MKVHFISIGGAVMHNLALALQQAGHTVSGSDDEITEPALGRLASAGLLPESTGWFPEKLTPDTDIVILGMHARADNPELKRANELGLDVQSFPQFVYGQSLHKTRIVIGGSHGKTTSTAMLMHVLQHAGNDFDYLVGSQLSGFNLMVKLSKAPLIVIEGDEYLTSPTDRRPKFHLYLPQVAMLTGIAWDHINVFPTFENYVEQFRIFLHQLPAGAPLAYFQGDENLAKLCNERNDLNQLPYHTHPHRIENGKTILITPSGAEVPLLIFGEHNLQNLSGVKLLAMQTGVSEESFYQAMASFAGTARRMETLKETADSLILRDFAHSPSKLKATVQAARQQYPTRRLVACFELHTFSSLSRQFLQEYKGCMDHADIKAVYFEPHTFALKKMEELNPSEVLEAFGNDTILIHTAANMAAFVASHNQPNTNLLLMSSGTFGGMQTNF